MSERLTHVDESGRMQMVDVSRKAVVRRTATAGGMIRLAPATVTLIRHNEIQKGDVLSVAQLAGIIGAKRTPELIPLCHGIEMEHIDVRLTLEDRGVRIEATAVCTDKTGIEMEVLTAVSVAALTVYDMCKAVDREMEIGEIRLVGKTKEPLE